MSKNKNSTASKAQYDLDTDRPWKARRRLRSRLARPPFDPACAVMLGELELGYGEHPAAGQCYWMLDERGAPVAHSVRVFLEEATPSVLSNVAGVFFDADAQSHTLTDQQAADLESKGCTADAIMARLVKRRAQRESSWLRVILELGLGGIATIAFTGWLGYGLLLLVRTIVRALRSL